MRAKRSFLAVLVFALALFAGCGRLVGDKGPNSDSGTLSVTVSVPQSREMGTQSFLDLIELSQLTVWATQGDITLEKTAAIVGTSATVVFNDITPGTWELEALISDTLQLPVYEGTAQAAVTGGQSTSTTMNLTAVLGSVDVQVSMVGTAVVRGEVSLIKPDDTLITEELGIDGVTDSSRPSTLLSATIYDVTPGIWPLQVELFDGLGQSLAFGEQDVEVLPGRPVTVNVYLSVSLGALDMTFSYALPPEPPTNVSAIYNSVGGRATLRWSPSISSDVTYRVYRSASETGPKTVLNRLSLPGTTQAFVDTAPMPDSTNWYWIVAHASNGLTSGFSEPAVISLPEPTGRIAFTRSVAGSGGVSQVWVMEADGSNQQKLTTNTSSARNPSWRPDSSIVYESGSQLYITSPGSEGSYSSVGLSGQEPAANPSGTGEFAYTNGQDEILVYYPGSYQSVGTAEVGGYPTWSPDGNYLLYTKWTGDSYDLMVRPAPPLTGSVNITWHLGGDQWDAAWAPNGVQIAYVGDAGIYVVDTDTDGDFLGTPTLVVPGGSAPAWSPDGSKIAFGRWNADTGDGDIWAYDLVTQTETRITSGPDNDHYPAWQPY